MAKPLGGSVSEAVLREAQAMLATGRSVEEVLAYLKGEGANAIASIRALQRLLGVTVPEAQQILHDSETWREMRRS